MLNSGWTLTCFDSTNYAYLQYTGLVDLEMSILWDGFQLIITFLCLVSFISNEKRRIEIFSILISERLRWTLH